MGLAVPMKTFLPTWFCKVAVPYHHTVALLYSAMVFYLPNTKAQYSKRMRKKRFGTSGGAMACKLSGNA